MDFIKSQSIGILALVIAVAIGFFGFGSGGASIGGVTNLDSLTLSDTLSAEQITSTDDATITDDLTVSGDATVSGEVGVQGFTQGGGCWATSTTAAAHTVTEANLLAYNCFIITWNTAAGTWTLPATSTMTTLLANVGDMREWVFENATSGTSITHTVAAGAGVDLLAVTANDDIIDETEFARLTCWRQTDTDVSCIISELLAAD